MPTINPLNKNLHKYLKNHSLPGKYNKQKILFERDLSHRSLNTELLKPKSRRVYSFRIDRKYRVIFIYIGNNKVEVIDINLHYS